MFEAIGVLAAIMILGIMAQAALGFGIWFINAPARFEELCAEIEARDLEKKNKGKKRRLVVTRGGDDEGEAFNLGGPQVPPDDNPFGGP
jgi:hypothetical protein